MACAPPVGARNFAGETTLRRIHRSGRRLPCVPHQRLGRDARRLRAGVPTVAVFGATDHEATGPAGPLRPRGAEPVECSPCLLRECPIDHRCMTRVSAERVAEEALDLLK